MTGIVKWFNAQRGYGFIVAEDRSEVFIHHTAIVAKGFRTLETGDKVEFQVAKDERGLRAEKLIVRKKAAQEPACMHHD